MFQQANVLYTNERVETTEWQLLHVFGRWRSPALPYDDQRALVAVASGRPVARCRIGLGAARASSPDAAGFRGRTLAATSRPASRRAVESGSRSEPAPWSVLGLSDTLGVASRSCRDCHRVRCP